MTDEEFMKLSESFEQYLATEKVFLKNKNRVADVEQAREIAKRIFPDSKIYTKPDPLIMGGTVLCIEDFYLPVREIKLFQMLIHKADNFDISVEGDEDVRIALLFNNTATRLR